MDGNTLLSAVFVILGLISALVPIKRNRIFGFRVKATYESEEKWKEKNRYFGLWLILTGVLLLLFVQSSLYPVALLSFILIAFLATYFKERSKMITPATLLSFFVLTNFLLYPILPETMAVHFSGLNVNGWMGKENYLLGMTLLYLLIFFLTVLIIKVRRDALPLMNGVLVFLLISESSVIGVQFYGKSFIAVTYIALAAFIVYIAYAYIFKIKTSGVGK